MRSPAAAIQLRMSAPNKSAGANAGWRLPFRFAVHGFWSGVAQRPSLRCRVGIRMWFALSTVRFWRRSIVRQQRPMNSQITLCLALAFIGVSVGCASIDHHSANSQQSAPDLYLHFFASFVYPEPPRLIVSGAIPRSGDFDIPMADGQHLQGHIQPRRGNFFVYFKVRLCEGTNVFNDEVELEKRYEPGPQPYDEKAPFICQPHFVLSSNPNPKSFLKRQAAAEREEWERENPLTARQVAKVKRRLHLMRPGMTKDEVFSMLGLSGYQNRLLPDSPLSHKRNLAFYQLARGERLMLTFDDTGVKTKSYSLADGEDVQMLDYASDTSHRLVIQAEFDTVIYSSNAPPVWQATSRWP
jgi:hypothetical protein